MIPRQCKAGVAQSYAVLDILLATLGFVAPSPRRGGRQGWGGGSKPTDAGAENCMTLLRCTGDRDSLLVRGRRLLCLAR